MYALFSATTRRKFPCTFGVVMAFALLLTAIIGVGLVTGQEGSAQAKRQITSPSNYVSIAKEPPAKLIIDPPLPGALAEGTVVIQFRTENLRVMPVFGPAAAEVSPRVGHLHVSLDDKWHWGHTSGQELVIGNLAPGPHKIAVALANANHEELTHSVVKFEVPKTTRPVKTPSKQKPSERAAKIIALPPLSGPLAKGVAILPYRTENVVIAPVVGPKALGISPPVGHLHVYVDDQPWYWVDASGGPLVLAALTPGPHKVLIELANADHEPLERKVVSFEVPRMQAKGTPEASAEKLVVVQAGTKPGDAATNADAIRPFRVKFSDDALVDLCRRIKETRWPDKETVKDQSQGIQLAKLQELAQYWANDYDWRKAEAKLNKLPQFITKIDGLDIHFIHVRSKHPNALPLLITHGWPGSILEQVKAIGPLTDPTEYGGRAEDAFDVVIPSLPGFGFSAKPTEGGWGPDRIAHAWGVLMARLSYKRYVAQGGDAGAQVANALGKQAPAGLLGIHTNMPATVPADVAKALNDGTPAKGLSDKEQAAFDQLKSFYQDGTGYAAMMHTRPQTIGYSLADSPVGLASFMLVHAGFTRWTRDIDKSLSKDEVLDEITLYWLTNTGASAARYYWENKNGFFNSVDQKTAEIKLPVAISIFPYEIYRSPETWAKRAYPDLVYFHEVDRGGHFAAWEQPELFANEMRAAFKSLRSK
jgi:pimeloyl-ACP methyl ester carboxylesterase